MLKPGIALSTALVATATTACIVLSFDNLRGGIKSTEPIEFITSTTEYPAFGTNTTLVADGAPTWLPNNGSVYVNTSIIGPGSGSGFGSGSGVGPSTGDCSYGGGSGLQIRVNVHSVDLFDDSIKTLDGLSDSMTDLTVKMRSVLEKQDASSIRGSEKMTKIIDEQQKISKEHKTFVRDQVATATSRIEAKATASASKAVKKLARRANKAVKKLARAAGRPRTTLGFLQKYQWPILFVVFGAIAGACLLFLKGKNSEATIVVATVALMFCHIVLTVVAHVIAFVITFPLVPFGGSVILLYGVVEKLAPGTVAAALRSVRTPPVAVPAAAEAAAVPGA